MNVAKKMERITIEEFEAMEKNERFNYELIDGVVMMSPSPSRGHQIIAHKIHGLLFNALSKSSCQTVGEFDIKCGENIFKPDLMIFCDEKADLPEIVFEILSPSTRRKDLTIKTIKYEEAGIKEYWIIDPKAKTITVHDYVNQTAEIYIIGDTIQSKARPEIVITVADVFV